MVTENFRQLLQHLPENISLNWFFSMMVEPVVYTSVYCLLKKVALFLIGGLSNLMHTNREVSTNLRTMNRSQVDCATRDYNDAQPFVPCVLRLSSSNA